MSAEDIEYMGDYKEFPTKESALDWLDNYLSLDERNNLIRALEQEPKIDILDKIRAEIEHLTITEGGEDYTRKMAELYSLKIKVLQIIDKCKAGSEELKGDKQ